MAVKDCDELSNIISLWILSWDDDLAKTIADLSAKKKDALMRAWKLKEWEVDDLTWRSAHELELRANSADIEMRAIVQAKILNDEIRVGDAYRELAFQIRETWWTIANWVDLLEKLRNASPADFESIAKQWGGKYANEPAKAIEEMKNAIAETVSANYSIRQYSDIKSKWLNSLRKQLRDWEITQWVFEDEVKKLHKDAMEQIAKWESPKNFAKLDSEWAAIKKIYWDNPVAAGKAWSQFIMARELLSDGWIDDWVLKAFQEMGAENLTWDLTLDQIAKYWEWDLDKLLARAYTNTEQLYRDWELRQAFREKLEELTAWMRVSADDIKKANSIMKTMQFAEQWATFSDIITADNAIRSARKRWYNVSDGTAFLNSLKAFAKKMDEDAKLLDKPIVINWVEMKPLDVIQIIYDITWDENILKLLRIGFYNDWTILSIATSRLLWWNKEAASKILRLFAKAWEQPRVTNVRDISLKAITWSDIKEWAKVGFFDFRQSLYSKDELNRARADFMDKLAERNKMRVPSEWLEIINSEPVTAEVLAEELKSKVAWWYLLVNDSKWRDNDILSKALDIANEWIKEEEKITVLFPRGWMNANFSVENWQLFYKTTKDDMFRDVAWTISIQSMWEARPTREILATAYEAKTGKNWDRVRYQPSYSKWAVDNQGRAISDQQYEYFSNSTVRDENWNLIPVFHWTSEEFDVFDMTKLRSFAEWPWIYFSEATNFADTYWWRTIECYLNITNPLVYDMNNFKNFDKVLSRDTIRGLADFLESRWLMDESDVSWVRRVLNEDDTNVWSAFEITWYKADREKKMWEYLEAFKEFTGYDWIRVVYKNFDKSTPDFWIAFSPEQIKYVDNKLPTSNPDMRYQSAWHWSPYSFKEFDREFARSGEWWEAHWAWIYVAAKRDIAEKYAWYGWDRQWWWWWMTKEQLEASLDDPDDFIDWIYDDLYITRNMAVNILDSMTMTDGAGPWTFKDALDWEKWWARNALERNPDDIISQKRLEALNNFKEEDFILWEPTHNVYEVEIPDAKKANTPTWSNYFEEWEVYSETVVDKIFNEAKKVDWFDIKAAKESFNRSAYKNWRDVYFSIANWFDWNKVKASRFFEDLWYDWIHYYWATDWEAWVIFNKNNTGIINQTSWMKRVKSYASQSDVNAEDAVKVQMFTKDRTWQQIADAYGFPVKIVQWDMIEWVAAYWAWWNGMIQFTDMVKESTAPHELFHAIFNTYVGKEQYDRILEDASKLFQVSKYDAEEILADSFAEWFNTWKFTYWDKIKAIGWKKRLSKQQKTFLQKVKDYFTDLAETLWLVDRHRDEVEQMFNDMVNMQYLPDAWKNVDAQVAMMKYNDELNNVAVKYFWEMLWLSTKEVDSQYVERVQKLLSEKLWIDLKSFDQLQDKAALWQRIDKQFALDRLTAWKYDKEIVDINAIKNEISNLTDEELEESIKRELWDIVARSDIKWNENIAHIREAYLDYKTAWSAVDSLMAKWKIVSLANGGTAQTMSMNDIKTMFQNWTFEKTYKEMFFPNQELSKKEMDAMITKINNDMFDTLSISFAENLVSAWYELPLINIKSLVYDYLNGKLDLNNKFVESFLYKNNIPFSQDWLRTLVDTLMPAEFRFDYENSLFKWRLDKLELPSEASVFREVDNRFMQDSYSALASIQMARAWDMPINYEEQILTDILDKYVSEVFKWVKDKSLTFQKAQQLKQEAWYALDMFEQDFLLPRYSKFISKQEMNGIMWMKYSLPIWVAWQNPDKVNQELISIRNKLLQKYKTTLKNAANNNDINMAIVKWTADKKLEKEIELRRDKLAESGWVIREVNWQYLVYDVKQALEEALNNLPDTIGWIEWLRVLWRDWIDRLSNKQAYAILRYVEAAKWLSTKLNYPTELMYKQNPMLLKYNFFEAYKVVDWLPRVLNWNLLNGDKVLSVLDNTAELDIAAKKNIFAWVISKFREQWYITTEDLNKIVHNWVSEAQATFKQIKLSPEQIKQATEKMETLYKKAFLPYTYLRDIPKWGQLLDWTPVRNMKKKVEDTIKLQYKQAMDDLKAIWVDNADELQTSIYITLDSWERVSVKEAWNMNMDSWKKSVFNDESVFVAWADEIKSFAVDPTWDKKALDKVVAQQKEYRESIINSYDSTLQSMLNQTQIISEAEANLSTAFMNDVRTVMRRYSLTNMMVDAMDALSWLNEEAARWMKDYLIGWKWRISFWKWKPWQILERNKLVQTAYQNYYVMDLSKLNSITPTSQAEDLALRLAKYFKNLERLLWSADGLTWCTTNKEINQAFFHLWEVVMNVNSVKWIFWLMSAVEQNQILKFFKFVNMPNSNPASIFVRRGKWNFQESLWWYRDYVEEISWISRGEFNEIFWADFSEEDFKRILQWLTGFTLTGAWWRTWTKILNVLNWSNMIFRMMMSYPWQLLTIPQQGTAYFLKQIWFEKELWIESLSEVDAIRTHYWVLDWAYNEIVLRWKSTVSPDDLRLDSYYNRYWIPDVDWVYKTSPIETSDDYINMYAKIDKEAASSISSTNKWFRQLDPYKDNANNIIDWLFARNFKNISFLKAIKNNDFMQFGSAKEFMSFMDDATISAEIKTRLMDRVSAYSGRNFRNILWLWFGWIDRAVSWSGFGNIMYWLMQLFNFRWSWWQNIFKQTWSNIFTALKMLWTANWIWSREWREAIAQYIATRPEFTNFVWALFNDLKWTWKLQRFQDNWRWPEDEDMYSMLDFIDYMTETLNMTSQWFQWLQSFWPFRPFDEARQSIMASAMNPTIYKDTFWVWAFFNALGKNFWRQWKPYNWIAKLAWAWTTDWPDWAWAYIENEWWKLSFWSLRYMVNEDMNSYGYTYEMTWQTWGIPSIIMWESKLGSDKNFSYEIDNTETWETIKQMFDSGLPWDTRWTYAWNLAKTFINWSQLAALPKNVMKAINRNAPSYFTANDLADTMQNTRAWLEFYKKWIVTPQTPEEAEIFFNTMLENAKYRPWSSNFTKSLIQYEDYWHMNGKEKWNEADAEMELWLDHMKHITNEHWEIQMNGNEKVVDPSWNKLVEDVKAHWYNETYTTGLIYNYAKNWLNNHSSDPNYQLYVKMLGQWQAYNLISTRQSQLIEALNAWAKGKDNKWTKTEFENVWLDKALLLKMWQQPLEWESISFFDKLQVLDEDDATVAALQIIQSQAKEWDRKILDRFFNVKENDDWSKSVSLKYNYEQTLKQIWAVSKAINDWNVDLAVAEASILTNMYKNDDPTGAITATLIDSVYNRIYDTNSFSPEQKQAAMIALFHKNKEFIQKNPEKLRALLWDDYDVYADYMNSMLYQWDWMAISNLESMQSSWKSSSWSWKAAASFSSALKNLASKLWGSWKGNWWAWGTTSYKQWVPVTIKGASLVKDLWLKGYTPTVNKISIDKYKPHLDLSLAKDINRNVKTTKSQQISNKKQLSKLEDKVTKATEAES